MVSNYDAPPSFLPSVSSSPLCPADGQCTDNQVM